MKMRFLSALALVGFLASSSAFAMTLEEARGAGAVGEKLDGYVAVVKDSPEAQALAGEVNAKRKQEYARISQANGQKADVVAKLAAQQIFGKLPSGALYQGSDGGWKKK